MSNALIKIGKTAARGLAGFVATLRALGIWRFPAGLDTARGKYRASVFASLVAQRLAVRHRGKTADAENELMEDPFLRFHANYSLTHVELNTPCTTSLANDIASVLDLRDLKILSLGARNLNEIFQLQLNGARAANITAIDLYGNIPEIQCMDFHDLKFADQSFDLIFWAGSFAYAHTPELALSEAIRVCRKPGYFALDDTFIGDATKETYEALKPEYIAMQPELGKALSELPADRQTLTKSFPTLEAVEKLFVPYPSCAFVLRRTYSSPHYNIIAKFHA